ncbi:MAG: hypothetical protein M3N13_02105, partial [Candidatus Eremiobacteraeota bacterium]|nr:hypothetical protein [Candidatus Eremiobacteraeota bacterium]
MSAIGGALPLVAFSAAGVSAAGPGTLSPSTPTLTYSGGPFTASNQTSPTGDTPPICTSATPCDQYALTVAIPAGDTKTYRVTVSVGWTNTAKASDYDLFVYQPDATGTQTGRSASSNNPEVVTFVAPAGTTNYTVIVVPYSVNPTVTFNATITLTALAAIPPPKPPTGPTPPPGVAIFDNFTPTDGLGGDWGEPSIGVDWLTEKGGNGGTIMSYGGFSTYALRLTFIDCTSPARVKFEATPLLTAALPRALGDPILFTDHVTGRTFVSQLNGTKAPNIDYTDDDGKTYKPSQGSGINSGFDHQTIATGPFPANFALPHTYPNAVYYCSQDDADANCALSLDGGQTFGPAVPISIANQCVSLHGHVKVAPDGTVYVPNRGCGGLGLLGPSNQGLLVSTDAGRTWTLRLIPNSKPGHDPSIGVGQNDTGKPATNSNGTNTIYFGYGDGDKHPRVVVSHDRGLTWENDTDIGAPFDIQNVAFPTVVAGDDNRAAVAFLGTNEPGGGTSEDTSFQGIWHLFVATTYDGGAHWTTVDVTPNDPVQRGVICLKGTLCKSGTRNLLDFIDSSIDKEGRINVVYADGCVADCVNGGANSGTSLAAFARQSGGKTLFSANDVASPQVPKQPLASASLTTGSNVHLTWSTPYDNGSALTGYKIYRGSDGVAETLIGTVAATAHSFDDPAGGATFFYYVTAVNGIGESARCDKVFPTAAAVGRDP